MAKMTIKGVTYEGTPEELREIAQLFGEKVGEEEQALKVGDYVSFTEDVFEHTKGKVSVIRQIDSGSTFKYGLDSPTAESDGWARDGDIRKATDEEIAEATAPKFEEGDYARTLSRGQFSDISEGEGEVVSILHTEAGEEGDGYSVHAETPEGETDFFRPQDLEKLEGEDAERIEQFAKAGRKLDEFKKGDIVFANWTSRSESGGLFEVENGPIGTGDGGNYEFKGGDVTLGKHLTLIAPVESRVDVE